MHLEYLFGDSLPVIADSGSSFHQPAFIALDSLWLFPPNPFTPRDEDRLLFDQ
jgi:hypothetical protein